jgi:hypothetical protein
LVRPPGTASASSDTWTNASGGDFATNGDWSLNLPPERNDDADFNLQSSAGYTVSLSAAESANAFSVQNDNVTLNLGTNTLALNNELRVGESVGQSGQLTLTGSTNGSVSASNVAVGGVPGGSGGVGVLSIDTGATVFTQGSTNIWDTGSAAPGGTALNLAGGTLITGNLVNRGGRFNWTSGTLRLLSSDLYLDSSNPNGPTWLGQTLAIPSSKTLIVDQNISIARLGGGALSISGGNVTTGGNVYVGGSSSGAGGAGTLNMASGSLDVSGSLNIFNTPGTSARLSGGALTAASLNTNGNPSLFNWTGGNLTITASDFYFANGFGALGTNYSIHSGMNLEVANGQNEFVAVNSAGATYNGTLNQDGGSNTVDSGNFYIAYGVGVYNFSGGNLSVPAQTSIGYYTSNGGSGTLKQSGSSAAAFGLLNVGDNGTGTYNLSAGNATAATVNVGIGSGANGLLNVSGNSSLTVSGTLTIYDSGSNAVNLSGATLSVGTLDTSGNATRFMGNGLTTGWTGGTLNISGADGLTVGSSGTVPLGSSVTLGTGRTLGVTSTLTIASGGNLIIAGGALSASNVQLNAGAAFSGSAGNLSVATFNQSGGNATFNATFNGATAALSQSRAQLAATTVGSTAVFAGGFASNGPSNVADLYNSSTNTWSTATLSQARGGLVAAAVGNTALFAGGYNNSVASNVVDLYNGSTNTWSTTSLSQARTSLAATAIGDMAIFAGGDTTGGRTPSNVVDLYNGSNNTWSTATLSQARFNLAGTIVSNMALFAGGDTNGNGLSNVVDLYNGSTNTWSTATLSQAREDLSATTVGSTALFAGGVTSSGFSNVVDLYNSTTNTWSAATLSQARGDLAATTVGNDAFFGGGEISTGATNVVDIYDGGTGLWLTSTLSTSRGYLAGTTVGDTALFAGGLTGGGGYSNVVDVLNTASLAIGTGNNVGSYTLSGGSLTAHTISLYNGGALTQTGGTLNLTEFSQTGGTFNVSGTGVVTVSGTLKVYDSGSTAVNLSGGTLSVGALDTSGNATRFLGNGVTTGWTGGTLNITGAGGLTVGSTGTPPLGSSLTLRAGQTLGMTNPVTIASGGTINLASGGALTAPRVQLNSGGTFTTTDGILSAATFVQSGGTAAFAGVGAHSTAALSQPREELAATTVGNQAIFAGGYTYGNGLSNSVDLYNGFTNSWSTATLSQAREQLSATTVGSTALFAGGRTVGGPFSNVVDIYNSASNTWSTAALSQPRSNLAATGVGAQALFAGGFGGSMQGSYGLSNVVDIYNSTSNSWSTAALSRARFALAATSVGNLAIFAGGNEDDSQTIDYNDSNAVDIYNSTNNTWSTAALSQAREGLAATSVGNLAFFAGGDFPISGEPRGVSNVVDIYNSTTNTWSTAAMSQARTDLAATTAGNEAFFAGGISQTGNGYSSVVDIYNADTGLWLTSTLSQPRAGLAGTAVGNDAIFAGGQVTVSGQSNVVDILSTAQLSIGSGNNVGNYTISGGSLTAQTINVSNGSALTESGGILSAGTLKVDTGGTFNWTAGTLNLTSSSLTVGTGGTFGSSLTLNSGQALQITGSGQSLNVTGAMQVSGGGLSVPTINQSGGTFTGSGTLSLAGIGGNAIVYNLSGGILTTGALIVGSGGEFNWTGGTLDVTGPAGVTIGSAGPLTTVDLSGGKGLQTTNAITVSSGGSITGGGTVSGQVVVTSGGKVSPGDPAIQTYNGGLNLGGGGAYDWQLATPPKDNSSGTVGVDFDQVQVTGGNLALGGTSNFNVNLGLLIAGDLPGGANNNSFWKSAHIWSAIQVSGAGTNTGGTNFVTVANGSYSVGSFATQLDADNKSIDLVYNELNLTAGSANNALLGKLTLSGSRGSYAPAVFSAGNVTSGSIDIAGLNPATDSPIVLLLDVKGTVAAIDQWDSELAGGQTGGEAYSLTQVQAGHTSALMPPGDSEFVLDIPNFAGSGDRYLNVDWSAGNGLVTLDQVEVAVPEPATWLLVATASPALLLRRRRR